MPNSCALLAEQDPSLPDGDYICRLQSATLTESKSSGRPQIAWAYTILVGDLVGEIARDYDGLDKEDSLLWLARKLRKYGYDPANVNFVELPAILEELTAEKPLIKIKAKTKGEYTNLLLEKVLPPDYEYDEDWAAPAPSAVEETDEEEEGVELKLGMKVQFTFQGEEKSGEVTAKDDEKGEATVKVGRKLYPVSYEDLLILEEENKVLAAA